MSPLPNAAPLAGLALRCQPDSRLVRLSREGQARGFEEIVRRYRGPLVAFAGMIVAADRAEDVVQDAFIKANAALLASEADVKLKPWLYTIVRNRALNDLRDEPSHEPLDDSFDGVLQPSEIALRRERLTGLLGRLKGLPRAQRQALVQRELEGRSHREIAVALGVSPGAVRGLIFRARTALRDAAGILIPMPALRALLNAGPLEAEATGTAVGGAAVGLTAGGGGGIAAKAGTTLTVAVLAVGSGVAIHNRGGDSRNDRGATALAGKGEEDAGSQGGGPGSQSLGSSGQGPGPGSHSGPGGGDSSGPGSGDSGDSSGPGSGEPGGGGGSGEGSLAEAEGHGGSGSSESSGHGGGSGSSDSGGSISESSGPGGSGHGGGGSGSSGSGSSGSGSSGSGSTDSGSSGPG